MADEEEEKLLEDQLELQLQEQKDSIVTIEEALAFDPSNAELLLVHEELVQAITNAEEGLFHLKRARLIREADLALLDFNNIDNDVKLEPLAAVDTGPQPLDEHAYPIGLKCRFRHTDGRWYDGQSFGSDDSKTAKISFLTPTSENMMICKFFVQQRCLFGSYCRFSHGVDVPFSSLKKYIPPTWEQSMVGSIIWALSDADGGIWKQAELKSLDGDKKVAHVVFQDNTIDVKLGTQDISLSEYAQMSDNEESSSISEESDDDSDCEEDEISQSIGFLESSTLQRGIQTETAVFAKWENHTRGIASKMMANMGFREGMGLGISGQGMVNPVPVRVLPPKQSLEHALKSMKEEGNLVNNENNKNKRSRGGKSKRDKKFADATRAAKDRDESKPDVFSLINTQLVEHHNKHGEAVNGQKQHNKDVKENQKPDRRALIRYENEVKELRIRVGKLEEMSNRNKNEKVVYDAAMRKLKETRKALAEAETAHESASDTIVGKEKEKRWLKF